MKRAISQFLLYIFYFGIVAACITLWYGVSPKLAPGNKMIYLSLGILILFAIWQYRGLREVSKNPWKGKYNKFIMYSIMAIIGIVILNIVWVNLVYYSEGTFYESWVIEYKETHLQNTELVITHSSIGRIIGIIVFSLYVLVILSSMLFAILYLGRIGVGANLAITSHNWFNGGDFDPSLFFEIVANWFGEVFISDFWGVILSGLWFLISTFFLKGHQSSVLDVST